MRQLLPPDFTPNGEVKFFLEKLKSGLLNDARRISQHLDNSKFKTVGCEIEIGPGKDIPSPAYEYNGSTVTLRGKIDRVDRYDAPDGNSYLSAIDYKTGDAEFKMSNLTEGSKIQLAYYLKALCADGSRYNGCIPAAFFYFPLNVKQSAADSEDEAENSSGKFTRLQGYARDNEALAALGGSDFCKSAKANGMDMESAFDTVDDLVMGMAQKLSDGDFAAAPLNTRDCRYCDYYRLCYRQTNTESGEEGDDDE